MAAFNYSLTIKDKAVARTIIAHLEETGKEYFTSDDLRRWYPDELWSDPAHEIGAWFAKMKFHGHLKRVGEEASQIESNHWRRVDLWRVLPNMYGWLASPPIDAYSKV